MSDNTSISIETKNHSRSLFSKIAEAFRHFVHILENKLPLILTLIGIAYIAIGVFYIVFYFIYEKQIDQFNLRVMLGLDSGIWNFLYRLLLNIVLNLFVGIALLFRKKWSLIVFIANGVIANIFWMDLILKGKSILMLFGLFIVPISIAVLLLFTRRELRAPFYKPEWHLREERHRVKICLKYTIESSEEIKSCTEDISGHGCFIRSDLLPKIEDKIKIEFTYNDKVENIEGCVVWIKPTDRGYPKGFGVLFKELTDAQKKYIDTIIENH